MNGFKEDAELGAVSLEEIAPDPSVGTLVTKLRGLDSLRNSLQAIGGMNQKIAMESMDLVPGMVTDDCPLGFYSQAVTKTRYSFALEAVDGEKKSVFKEIIQKIISFFKAVIAKLAEWFRACKALILKFFKGKDVVPKDVGNRFALIASSVTSKGNKLIDEMSEKDRTIFSEFIDKENVAAFMAICEDCVRISTLAANLDKFIENKQFFKSLKDKVDSFKSMALDAHEKADKLVSENLHTDDAAKKIEQIVNIFNSINDAHESNVKTLTAILKTLESEGGMQAITDGSGSKTDAVVTLLSDIIHAEAFVVQKADVYVQTVSQLMSKIGQKNVTRMPIIVH